MKKQTENDSDMPCWIYKSNRKDEMYLYLAGEDTFHELPENLQQSFGRPVFVMQLELNSARRLARADVNTVMQSLNDQGYYLQMPPRLEPDLHFGD